VRICEEKLNVLRADLSEANRNLVEVEHGIFALRDLFLQMPINHATTEGGGPSQIVAPYYLHDSDSVSVGSDETG
jgi:hypothetical protein